MYNKKGKAMVAYDTFTTEVPKFIEEHNKFHEWLEDIVLKAMKTKHFYSWEVSRDESKKKL